MPRRPRPLRRPKVVYPNGTQNLRERFANRLAALGHDPRMSPLLVAMWLQNPCHPLRDGELERLATDLLERGNSNG